MPAWACSACSCPGSKQLSPTSMRSDAKSVALPIFSARKTACSAGRIALGCSTTPPFPGTRRSETADGAPGLPPRPRAPAGAAIYCRDAALAGRLRARGARERRGGVARGAAAPARAARPRRRRDPRRPRGGRVRGRPPARRPPLPARLPRGARRPRAPQARPLARRPLAAPRALLRRRTPQRPRRARAPADGLHGRPLAGRGLDRLDEARLPDRALAAARSAQLYGQLRRHAEQRRPPLDLLARERERGRARDEGAERLLRLHAREVRAEAQMRAAPERQVLARV